MKCVLIVLLCGICYSQPKCLVQKDSIDSTIHEMLLFKWCKEGDKNVKRYIKIDSLGNVIIKNQNFLEKIEMKPFTACVQEFIRKEKLPKIAGNDGTALLAEVPKPNRQNMYISIMLTSDYIRDKNLKNKSYYLWTKLDLDKLTNEYELFKYIGPRDANLLKRFLE